MTTQVRVMNDGPQPVQVKVMNHLTTGDKVESKYRGAPIPPGLGFLYYVHSTQSLEVEEVPHAVTA